MKCTKRTPGRETQNNSVTLANAHLPKRGMLNRSLETFTQTSPETVSAALCSKAQRQVWNVSLMKKNFQMKELELEEACA